MLCVKKIVIDGEYEEALTTLGKCSPVVLKALSDPDKIWGNRSLIGMLYISFNKMPKAFTIV